MTSRKDIQKRMVINKTLREMQKQIDKLEEKKQYYIDAAKDAKKKGLPNQYNLAMSGLRMALIQQRRVQEMKLNFEITMQMKDVALMTNEFVKGMSILSKDMAKLSKEKTLIKVGQEFENAMEGIQVQTETLDDFMEATNAAFSSGSYAGEANEKELDSMVDNQVSDDSVDEEAINKEIERIKGMIG